jgi:VIT1/CCC1 family predicted Fe2+/Mn2+ transporter
VAHHEHHSTRRVGWLRAAILGANDGIVSTASLIVGVDTSGASRSAVLTAAVAGLAGGALSMAVGEYVSVSSQRDAERADLALERRELDNDPAFELAELAAIYEARGLPPDLAGQVASELMRQDALDAHSRDELGITEVTRARPALAAGASAAAFTVGAAVPTIVAAVAPSAVRALLVGLVALMALAGLGALGARLGGASTGRAAVRLTILGALAMAVTAGIGLAIGTAI